MTSSAFNVSSVSEAVQKLFNINLADYSGFRNSVNALLKIDGFIKQEDKPKKYDGDDHRYPTKIFNDQLTKLHNAILLQAFFKPRQIQAIFEHQKKRDEAAGAVELIMINRQSILGVGLLSAEILSLISILKSELDLAETKLPNPFIELPQLSLSGVSNIMKELITQSAALSTGESMIAHYLSGELALAYSFANEMHSDNPVVKNFRDKIIAEYQQADDFDKTLDFFK